MVGNVASSQGVETFQVPLEGWIVECDSIDDAVAVKNAEQILSSRNYVGYAPAELDRLAAILVKYGRKSAAVHLRQRARQKHGAGIDLETAAMKS